MGIKYKSIVYCFVVFLMAMGWTQAVTGEKLLKQAKWGDTPDKVCELLKSKNIPTQVLKVKDKQALSKVMIKNGLLETLNRFGFKDTFLPNAQGPKAKTYILFTEKRRSYVLLFSKDSGLYQVYVRVRTPVDKKVSGKQNPFDPNRLNLIREEIRRIKNGYKAQPIRRDRHGNGFLYRGGILSESLVAQYLPEQEELRIIYYKNG